MEEAELFQEEAFERQLPSVPEAEKAVLGSILLDNSLIAQAIELLQPEDFYVPSNNKVFIIQISLFQKGKQIDPFSIAEELKLQGDTIESIGGWSFLSDLTYGLPNSSDISEWCRIIKGKSTLRKLIKAHSKGIEAAKAEDDLPEVVAENASKAFFDILTDNTKPSFTQIGVLAHRSIHRAHQIEQMGTAITGLNTGFTDLNAKTLGLQKKDLIIICARPAVGKTAWSLMLAQNAAFRFGANVAFFSLEMGEDSLSDRILCSEASVDSQRYRSGFCGHQEWDRIHAAEQVMAQARFFINEDPNITVLRMKAHCRRLIVEQGQLDLIVVDYLQLMLGTFNKVKKYESRQQEVTQISRELKILAKELNCPVVALSQLNRSPEGRPDKRPHLADIRESGSVEQDADLVGALYREDMHKSPSDHAGTLTNTCEFILLKQRNGPTGTINLRFDPATGRFDDLYQQS